MINTFLLNWTQLSAAGRVLVLNGLTFNLGFYMLLPYLAGHLQDTVGLGGWAIGLVLGARVFCQQGLFLIGGTLGDIFGYRAIILAGCLIRSAGFILLGFGESLPLLLVGACLAGFAGALFTPCSQAYLALEYPDIKQRHQVFSLQNLLSEAGMLLGPLVGLALLGIDFYLIGLSSGTFFLLLFLLQWFYLPVHQHSRETYANTTISQPATHDFSMRESVMEQWWSMLCHTRFIKFVLFASIYQLLFHQLYLAIPASAQITTGDTSVITWVFSLSSILGITLQLPIAHLANKFQPHRSMALGMSLMGCAYLVLIFDAMVHPFFPYLLCAALLSIGSLFVFPLLGAHIPYFAQEKEMGRYYGLYACFGGVVASISNVVIGWGLPELTPDSIPEAIDSWLWLALFFAGLLSAIGLYFSSRPFVNGNQAHSSQPDIR
ncbi:MFS transporter [Marinomonas agarivorans]|nr:MFS transporter [Marinomonas agarivorans]